MLKKKIWWTKTKSRYIYRN